MSNSRFRDTGRQLSDFADEFLVRCPQCDRQAQVARRAVGNGGPGPRLVCPHCGYTPEKQAGGPIGDAPVDWYFHQPLWLQIPCAGEILWAYNAAHLDFLESYVRAALREDEPRTGLLGPGIRNTTLASRLPPWIKSAKNRDDILQCIAKLRKLLASA